MSLNSQNIRDPQGSQNVLLFSHQRYGKKSLMRQAFLEIKKKLLDFGAMHVELHGKRLHIIRPLYLARFIFDTHAKTAYI